MARGRGRGAVIVARAVDDRDISGAGEVERLTQAARLSGKNDRIAGTAPVCPIRSVCLWVDVYQRHGFPGTRKLHGQIDRRGGFAGAALFTNNSDSKHVNNLT